MNILLVSPESKNTFWSLKYALSFISKKAALPPLGLVTIAAMLPPEWNLRLVDMTTSKLSDDDIRWADYVFISAMGIQSDSVLVVVERCKAIGRKIVAGGPLFTAAPEEFSDIDHLVLNEAEITLPMFLSDIAKGSARHIYTSDQWADVHETPIPLWRLIKLSQYAVMSVQFSRGCPFNCDFCDVTTLFGHKSRTKTKAQVIAELDGLYDAGWRGEVFFVDDNFIGNKHILKTEILPAILDWMKRKGRPFTFNTQASVNLSDDAELMQLMVQAGFNCVFVGIETPSEDSLAECNKVQNKNRDLIECVKKIQRSGMEVQAGFILGFDSDNNRVFDNMVTFIQESGIVTAMVGLLNAPRGTKLYDRMASENRLLRYGTGDNTDLTMNFTPIMNPKELIIGYQKVVQTIYSHENYYNRILTFLKSYKPSQDNDVDLTYCDVKAFFRSIWRLGIVGKGRRYYWKLLLRAVIRPQDFNIVMTYAIMGFHFRTMFNELQGSLKKHRTEIAA